VPACDYEIQVSADLSTWAALSMVTADVSGRATSDVAPSGAQRFFRALLLP
jgi:hypothetical protein